LEQAIPKVQRFGLRGYEGWFTALLAEAQRLAGHLERAEALATNACQIAAEASFPVGVGWAQLSLGRTAAARRDVPAARARLEEALATFTATHSRYECARTHLDLAALEQAIGDHDAARRHLVTANEFFRQEAPRQSERVERLAAEWGLRLPPGSPS